MDTIALEMMAAHGPSALYQDLTAHFTKYDKIISDLPTRTSDTIAHTLLHSSFSKDLKAIVKKHLNLTLRSVDVVDMPAAAQTIPYATCHTNITSSNPIATKQGGWTSAMILAKINNLYDKTKGSFTENYSDQYHQIFEIELSTGMWNANVTITSQERAAAVLHELGHTFEWVSRSWRFYEVLEDLSDVVVYTQSHPDRAVVRRLLDVLHVSPDLTKDWQQLLAKVDAYFSISNSLDDDQYWEALSVLTTILTSDVANTALRANQRYFDLSRTDKLTTTNHTNERERLAEEYASRHGAYAALVSFRLKIEPLYQAYGIGYTKQNLQLPLRVMFTMWSGFRDRIGLPITFLSSGADQMLTTVSLNVESAKAAFSNPLLSASQKTELKRQITEMERLIATYRSQEDRKGRALLRNWVTTILKTGKLALFPWSSRLQRDYTALQSTTRSLSRHSLYYLANK